MIPEEERENAWLRAHLDARKGFSDWGYIDTEVEVEWGVADFGGAGVVGMVHDLYSPNDSIYQLLYDIENKRGVEEKGSFLVRLILPDEVEDGEAEGGEFKLIGGPYHSLSMALTIMLQHYNSQTIESLIDKELER